MNPLSNQFPCPLESDALSDQSHNHMGLRQSEVGNPVTESRRASSEPTLSPKQRMSFRASVRGEEECRLDVSWRSRPNDPSSATASQDAPIGSGTQPSRSLKRMVRRPLKSPINIL